jgi:hypothetical protein
MIVSTALVIATQVSWFNLYCTLYYVYFNYVTMFLKSFYQLSEIERSPTCQGVRLQLLT